MPSGSGEAVGSDARVSQGKGYPKGDARTLSVLSCVTLSAGAEPVGCTSDLLLRECSCAGQITWALGSLRQSSPSIIM